MNYLLYHICKPKDELLLNKGYVGVTKDLDARLERHFSGLGNVIVYRNSIKYDELSYSILFEGTLEEVLNLEKLLRPKPGVGWNIAAGGGMPPSSEGRKWTEKQRKFITASVSGPKNKKWKGWWVIDGKKYISLNEAGNSLGVCKRTVYNRVKSEKFPEWQFEPK